MALLVWLVGLVSISVNVRIPGARGGLKPPAYRRARTCTRAARTRQVIRRFLVAVASL